MVLKSRWGKITLLTSFFRTLSNLKKVIALLVSIFFYDRQISFYEGFSTLRTIFCPLFHALHAKGNSTGIASNRIKDENLTNRTFKAWIFYFNLLCLDCEKYRASDFFLAHIISYFHQILFFHLFKVHDIFYSGNFHLKKLVFFFLYRLIASCCLLPLHKLFLKINNWNY